MMHRQVDAHIHYRFEANETEALKAATVPLMSHLKAVDRGELSTMRRLFEGRYLRRWQLELLRKMLLRAAKDARANLATYFPMMRDDVITQAERLENVTQAFWARYEHLAAYTAPVD